MKNTRQTLTGWILSLLLFIVVISGATTVTLNFKSLYYFDIDYLNIEQMSFMNQKDMKKNYDALIEYNQFCGPKKLEFPSLPMSQSGRKHFKEVKTVFLGLEIAGIVALLVVIAAGVKQKLSPSVWKRAGSLMIGIPVILGILMAVAWDWLFTIFHQLVFRNGDWLFDPVTDPVINMLPDEFFLHCAAMIVGIVVVCGVICIGYSRKKVHEVF